MTARMHSSHAHFLMIISLACGHTIFQRTIYETSSLCKCFKTSSIIQSCPSVLLPETLSLEQLGLKMAYLEVIIVRGIKLN